MQPSADSTSAVAASASRAATLGSPHPAVAIWHGVLHALCLTDKLLCVA